MNGQAKPDAADPAKPATPPKRPRFFRKPRAELDDPLRRAMRQETEMFFAAIVREERNVLDLLDSDFTFLSGGPGGVNCVTGWDSWATLASAWPTPGPAGVEDVLDPPEDPHPVARSAAPARAVSVPRLCNSRRAGWRLM